MLLRNFDLAVQHEGVLIILYVHTYVHWVLKIHYTRQKLHTYVVVACLSTYVRTYVRMLQQIEYTYVAVTCNYVRTYVRTYVCVRCTYMCYHHGPLLQPVSSSGN